jgi:excisionase family DNA binding protein
MNEFLESYPPVLSVNDVAKILGVTSKTVRNLVKARNIPSIKVGRLIRIPKDELISFIENTN